MLAAESIRESPSMTTETQAAKPRIKITYATLRNDNDELHALYEAGVEQSKAKLGGHHRNYIDGHWVEGSAGRFEVRSPIDSEILVGTFAKGDRADTQRAIGAAGRPRRPGGTRPGRSGSRSSSGRATSSPSARWSSRRTWPTRSARAGSRPSAKSRRPPTSCATTPRS